MNQVEHVAGIAAQPIEAGDRQLIAWSQEGQHGGELNAPLAAAARHLLRSNDLAPLSRQARQLRLEVLVDGADAGAADTRHVTD
jgi:hypothetical protein